ncbi:hypothetical protein [Castellaniella sp.]|uniref:hypothetical protein n=1 Tax=Castellaniella sp. TaxID=1955812 RepID=UPI002AFE76DF|nr:hypothetical protein [Castellaniella sp.]
MKIAFTICGDRTPRIESIRVGKDELQFTVDGVVRTLTNALLSEFIGHNERSEINSVYVFLGEHGELILRNKMMESEASRRPGMVYLKNLQTKLPNIGQVYLPFTNGTLKDAAVRLNVPTQADIDALGVKDYTLVENDHHAYVAFSNSVYPSVTTRAVKSKNYTTIFAKVVRGGKPLKRSGMKVYAKTDAGYLNRRYAVTDKNGVAEFRFAPMLLDPGDKATVKIGFRYYSNLDSVEITA